MDIPSHSGDGRIRIALFTSVSLIVVILYLYLNSLSDFNAADGEYLRLSETEALPLDVDFQRLESIRQDWIPVELPFHWRNQFADSRAVWYRMPLSGAEIRSLARSGAEGAEQVFGIYIWRINQTANVWLNGTLIGSGGRTEEPMARHWNSPLYFTIPDGLLREENVIHIKHFAQHSWGSMEAVVVGTDDALRPIFERRYFVQHDVALGLFVFVAITGIFCFAIWFYRRREKQYLWFAIASVGLSFFCLNQFIRYLPVDPDLWRWLSNISTDLWASSMIIFLLRSLRLSRPRVERLALTYLASGVPVYFYASYFQVFDINIFYHIGSLIIGAYAFYISAASAVRTRDSLPIFYCCVLAIVFVAGVHDTVMQAIVNNGWLSESGAEFRNHFNFVHFAAPLIFLFIGASLVKQFIDSMNAADRLNVDLEQRVNEAREELAENYRAIEEVLVRQTASEERERIYRDLHDDVGSKLLSLYYRLDKESDSTLAKSALEDLRDIVSRKSLESCPLSTAVQQWRSEAFNRAQDAGIKLLWQFDAEQMNIQLDESQHAQLRRMLREVLSNAILHNEKVSEIRVIVDIDDTTLRISVSNDGVATPASDWASGRGISNLRVRARDMRGTLTIDDLNDNWVKVAWSIPL